MKQHTYIAIDLKSFYASVECRERGLDPLDTNLVVADESRTDKTICLAVTPSLKSYGISGRGRLFEVKQRVKEANAGRQHDAPGHRLDGTSHFFSELQADPSLAIDFIIAPPRMAYYIMGLPHHVSKTRPQMPMSDRAAQFAPFAALTGYDSAIKETGRLTDERIELDEGALTALNMRYQLLMDALDEEPEVEITYFKPDERKAGGAYVTATGAVIKVDDFERLITMQDGTKIPMDDILSIDGELFLSLE